MDLQAALKKLIVDVPDFPTEGVTFKDITPLLDNGEALLIVIDHLKARYATRGVQKIVAIESRGFLLGSALAYALGIGLVLVRKPGKLPRETREVTYALEYGTDTLQMHVDALETQEKVVIVDDVLATGGTALATAQLVEASGAHVMELACLMELGFLNGRARLGARPVYSVIQY
ncbi:MAG: adenine phosphoribosyltransferase [Deltaproteobacteria bacterium]|nr:MAG: adenine phosphoribosyltransferase [Deltaproteobacteria bacterium]